MICLGPLFKDCNIVKLRPLEALNIVRQETGFYDLQEINGRVMVDDFKNSMYFHSHGLDRKGNLNCL